MTRAAIIAASAQAVEPSYIEALATSMSSSSATWALEFVQRLQRALRDFRLVRRVGGEKFAALDQVIDARRHVMAISARAKEKRGAAGGRVLLRQPLHMAMHLDLALRARQIDEVFQQRAFGTSTYRSSMDFAPMTPSICSRSTSVSGRYLMRAIHALTLPGFARRRSPGLMNTNAGAYGRSHCRLRRHPGMGECLAR